VTLAIDDDAGSDSSVSSGPAIDPEDPMYEYLVAKRKEEKVLKKAKKVKSKGKHKNETPEERRARKARKREKKERKARKNKSEGMKGVEDLLKSLGGHDIGRSRSRTPSRTHRRSGSHSLSPVLDRYPRRPRSLSRSRTPPRNRGGRSRPSSQYSDDERRHHEREAGSRRFTDRD